MGVCELWPIKLITTPRVVPEPRPHKERQIKWWVGGIELWHTYTWWICEDAKNKGMCKVSFFKLISLIDQFLNKEVAPLLLVNLSLGCMKRTKRKENFTIRDFITLCLFLYFSFCLVCFYVYLSMIITYSLTLSMSLFVSFSEFSDLVNLRMYWESLLAGLYWLNDWLVCAWQV